jgi:hypothetical protein
MNSALPVVNGAAAANSVAALYGLTKSIGKSFEYIEQTERILYVQSPAAPCLTAHCNRSRSAATPSSTVCT